MKEKDFGYILWKLESLEKFFPCYESLIHRHSKEKE